MTTIWRWRTTKTLVAASSEALATIVARDLEVPTSGVVNSARNLGIDVAAPLSQTRDGTNRAVLQRLAQRR